MNNFEAKIAENKSEYIAQINRVKQKYDHIIIYGAGKIGKSILGLLRTQNIKVSAFCVTDKSINRYELMGLPVFSAEELSFDQSRTLILIGVREKWSHEVIQTLKQRGFSDYLVAPSNVEYFFDKVIEKRKRPTLEITPKIGCSVQCKYCPQDLLYKNYFKDKHRSTVMTFDTFKACIDKTPDNLLVEFAGFVEPFLNSEAVKMILYAHEIGREISLYTTLVGLTKDIFEQIENIPFYEVVLHVPDAYNFANIPMTDEYFQLLYLVLDTKKPDGSPWVDTANCQSNPHPTVLAHTEGKVRIFSELVDRAGNLEDKNLLSFEYVTGKILCDRAPGLNHNILLPDGSIVLCCMDFGLRHILGNLLTQSYKEIMNGTELNRLRRSMLDDSSEKILCRSCSSAIRNR
nr:SPASM domain-containing protein [uncultured Desulfobacter sp.]